jgi:hypothetical protein
MKCKIMILVTACCGCVHTDTRESGYEAGRKMVRDIRDLNGKTGEMAARIAEMSPNPPDPKKSPEWNGGFRAGVREELDHPSQPKSR